MIWAERSLGAENIKAMRIAVAGLIFNAFGKILLHCRGPVAMDAVGCLEGIGGSLEETEEELQPALMRELQEEIAGRSTNGQIVPCRFSIDRFLVCSHLQFESTDGALKDWAVATFLCRLLDGEPTVGVGEWGRTMGIGWFDIAEFDSWTADQRREVSLVDCEGKPFKKEVGLSIWVPVVIEEYKRQHGHEPWRGFERQL